MLRLAWRYRVPSLIVILFHVLLVGLNVGALGLTGLGIDYIRHQVDPASPAPQWPFGWQFPATWSPMAIVSAIALAVLTVALVNAGLKYAAAVSGAQLTQRVLIHLRTKVYDKLQRLSFHFFEANQTSSLINRAAGDVQAVRIFVDGVMVRVLIVLLTLIVYLIYMFRVHVALTVLCLLTSPLLWFGAIVFSRHVQPAYRRASELLDDLILTLVENTQGMYVVKGFAREPEEMEKFARVNQQVCDQKRGIFWSISLYQPLMGLLTQVNMLVLLAYGGYLVIQGRLQLGTGLFVFANLLHEFAGQVGQITNIANTMQTSLAGAQRVFEVLDAPVQIQTRAGAVRLPRATGGLRFEDVTFQYPSEEASTEPVLKEINLEVCPGQCLGIMGETGAGKSTLLSLVARFYDVTEGSILLDGVDLRNVDLDDLRRSLGIVFQESFLFSNTVAANIAFGYPDATEEMIRRAARLAAADEFIQEMPHGYETVVGEYGSNLSGGQRQRMSIARALLLDPPILLLDDAMAAVDPDTEREIRQSLQSARQGRTTLVVSNRISTLRHADRIAVLHRGRLIQQGTHRELLRREGPYRRLAELQFADQVGELSPSND